MPAPATRAWSWPERPPDLVAEGLEIADEAVQVSSTGVIGVQMPMDRIRAAIPALIEGLSSGTLDDVASGHHDHRHLSRRWRPEAEQSATVSYTVAGIAKGAGMIMPNMATMLSFIISDAAVEPDFLQQSFRRAVDSSFNAITVDGDTSTNDTCLIMANGMAGNPVITRGIARGGCLRATAAAMCCSLWPNRS